MPVLSTLLEETLKSESFRRFRENFLKLANTTLIDKHKILQPIFRPFDRSSLGPMTTKSDASGCFEIHIFPQEPARFGTFLARYTSGWLSRNIKSAFTTALYQQLTFPEQLRSLYNTLDLDLEKLLYFLFDRLIRVQIELESEDIKDWVSPEPTYMPESLKSVISVAQLFIPVKDGEEALVRRQLYRLVKGNENVSRFLSHLNLGKI